MSETRPPPDAEVECANCGRRFAGRYCPDCGQEDRDFERPLKGFARELLSDFLAFDARIWRTLPLLVARPGRLAREYLDGRRARYVPPQRLYVFLAAALFAALALTSGGPIRFGTVEVEGGVLVQSVVGIELAARDARIETGAYTAVATSRAIRNLEGVNRIVVATMSYVHFLLLPLFAVFLKLFWRRRWYLEHLVFASYLGSLVLLVGVVVVGVYALVGNPPPPEPASVIAYHAWSLLALVMAYRSLRSFYGDGRLRTALKLAAVTIGYGMIAVLSVFGIFMATLHLVYA